MFFIPLFAEQWMVASTCCFLTDEDEEEDLFFKNPSCPIHRGGRENTEC